MRRHLTAALLLVILLPGLPDGQRRSPPCPGAALVSQTRMVECVNRQWHVYYAQVFACRSGEERVVESPLMPTGSRCDSVSEVWDSLAIGELFEEAPAPEEVNVVAEGDTDFSVQKMVIESVIDDLTPVVVLASGGLPRHPSSEGGGLWAALRPFVRPLRPLLPTSVLAAADAGTRPLAGTDRRLWLEPLDQMAQTRGPRRTGGRPPVRMLLTSLGTSTGEAFQAAIVNDTGRPVLLDGLRLVVEPLKPDTARRARNALQKFQAEKPTTVKMTGYCLEFLRPPPIAGTLFRVAPQSLQQQFGPMRRILEAGQRLRIEGRLTPDSEPRGYYHAIRQWAIWTTEMGFTEASFGDAFVAHTKKVFTESTRPWTGEVERTLRAAVPGRWADIQQVLAAAGAPH
jgi:hypothetical protein